MKKLKVYSVILLSIAIVVAVLIRNRAKIKAETRNLNVDSYAVTVASVERKTLTDNLDLVGTINASNDVHVVSESSGKVIKVLAGVGDYERAGGAIVQLDDKLQSASLELATVNLDKATKDYDRYKRLYSEHSVTDAQLEGAELAYQSANDQYVNAHRQFTNTTITSPIAGVITSRGVDLGAYVSPGMVVAEVVDIARLKITVNVDENDVIYFKPGNKVTILTDVYPGVEFSGYIKSISSKGDGEHTYPVEVDFYNSREYPLKAGMFAHVHFSVVSSQKSLVIPRQALVGSVENAQVYVVENGIARLKNIVVGATYNSYMQVLNGLQPGESVVTNGQDNLEDGYKVNVVSQSAAGKPSSGL